MQDSKPDQSTRVSRRSGGTAGVVGAVLFALIALACFATLPYTLGEVSVVGIEEHRYEAGNLELNLMPPKFELGEEDQQRITTAESGGAFVPNLAFGTVCCSSLPKCQRNSMYLGRCMCAPPMES